MCKTPGGGRRLPVRCPVAEMSDHLTQLPLARDGMLDPALLCPVLASQLSHEGANSSLGCRKESQGS